MSYFHSANTPFSLANDSAYQAWREWKLRHAAKSLEELVVEVNDPRQFTDAEHHALMDCIRRNNMVIYAGTTGDDPDKAIPRKVAEQFGVKQLNHNWLADEDGVTSLTVNTEGNHPQYIPYTNRPISWHTDGYYNPSDAQVGALLLHCVHNAAQGGENALMDHEIAYILLRDSDPEIITTLMQDDVMTIPPGTDIHGELRDAAVGPVFSVDSHNGNLHMRYTARRRNINWKDNEATRSAVTQVEVLLDSHSPYIYRGTLQPGMGLISNNVLHDRSGFSDQPYQPKRLLYRARYFDRIPTSGIESIPEEDLVVAAVTT